MPEVLKLLQCSNLGGMEQSVYRLLPPLTERGMGFRVLTPRPFGPGRERLLEVDPHASDFPYRGRFGWRSFGPFRDAVRERAAGTSHIWLTGTDVACLRAMRGLPQRKLMGHHYHHRDSRLAPARWWAFYNGLCRQLDALTYPSDFARNEALEIAPWLRGRSHVVRAVIDVVYAGVDERLARRAAARGRLGLAADAWIVGSAGWLIRRKRPDVFLHTARLVADALPGARFVICGDGPLEAEMRTLAGTLGIADRVLFAGWQADLTPWYDAMDVLLFNSDFDAFGLTPAEAAARGVSVVASVRCGGLPELLRNGVDAFLLREHDPAALACAIHRLHEEPGAADDMRESLASRIREQHELARVLDFYTAWFNDAL